MVISKKRIIPPNDLNPISHLKGDYMYSMWSFSDTSNSGSCHKKYKKTGEMSFISVRTLKQINEIIALAQINIINYCLLHGTFVDSMKKVIPIPKSGDPSSLNQGIHQF